MLILNPAIWMWSLPAEKTEWQIVMLLMGSLSILVAVLWSKLFLHPGGRLMDWLSVLFLYGSISIMLGGMGPMGMLLALITTVWGAAWAWRYINIYEYEESFVRLGLMLSGMFFVLAAPVVFWNAVAIVTEHFEITRMHIRMRNNVVLIAVCSVGLLPGIIISILGRRALAESAREEEEGKA